MRDVLYCTGCKVYWWTDNQRNDACPECGRDRFFLLRGGDFGTAIYFHESGDDIDAYRLIGEEPEPVAVKSVGPREPNEMTRLREWLGGKCDE